MSVVPVAEPTTETVQGIVAGIIAKPPGEDGQPRWQVEVQVEGSQYTKKLWSRDAELIGQVNMMIGHPLAFMCGISNWTNKQNQPVRSLWINGYGIPGAAPAPVAPAPQPMMAAPAPAPLPVPGVAPTQAMPTPPVPAVPVAQALAPQAPPPDSTEKKIHRQTAAKVAVQLLPFLTPDQQTFTSLITISERLVGYFDNGVPSPAGAEVSGDPGPATAGVTYTDDDVPF